MTSFRGEQYDFLRTVFKDYAFWVFAALLLVAAAPYFLPVWNEGDLAGKGPYFLELWLICGSVFACFAGRSRLKSKQARRFWDWIGIGFLFWLISKLPDASGPGLGWDVAIDLAGLAMFFALFVALSIQPDHVPKSSSLSGRLQSIAAGTILLGLIVYFTVLPAAADPKEYWSWVPDMLVTLLLDGCLVLVTVRWFLRARDTPWRPVAGWLGVAWIFWFGTDFWNGLANLGVWNVKLGTPIDLLWGLPFLPFLLAARLGHQEPASIWISRSAEERTQRTIHPVFGYAIAFLLLHIVLSGTGWLSPELQGMRTWTAVVFGAVLCGLAIAYDRALSREKRVLQSARDAAVAEAERARMVTRLEATQRLESLGVLAGGVAHDFNNVLQSILGNAELLGGKFEEGSTAEAQIGRIETAARRAAELVDQILTYAGRRPTRKGPVRLNDLVEDTVKMVPLPLRNRAGIRMEHLDRDLFIHADPTQIRQVVLNLILNACESLDESGTVMISLWKQDSPDVEGADSEGTAGEIGSAVLEVRDTGSGMDAEARGRMFEPFFTTKGAGRGLGLAATWGIVGNHAGVIDIQSKPGLGSTVTVTFPISPAAEGPQGAEPTLRQEISPDRTVLVVDDDAGVVSVVQTALEERGCSVVTACDGRSGIDALAGCEAVSLILLDLTMPGMAAPEILRSMREIRPEVPVIIMTGYDYQTAIPKLRRYSPDGFLYKPFKLDELFSVMGQTSAMESCLCGVGTTSDPNEHP